MRYFVIAASSLFAVLFFFILNSLDFFNAAIVSVALFTSFWFWRMRLLERFWLGFSLGFVLDSISILPFGTHLAVFIFLAAAVEVLQKFFSDKHSLLAQAVSIVSLTFIFLVLTPLIARLIKIFA